MRETFVYKQFNPVHASIIDFANRIIDNYGQQGYDLSLRQLYYQFIANDNPNGGAWFPNSEQSYKRLGDIISDARLAGLIDWETIVDRARSTEINPHWNTPGDILNAAARSFRLDTWSDQPNHIIVMVEKDALSGVLLPVCQELDIAFTANKGYASSSHMYRIGQSLRECSADNKDNHVLYLGDHDPSGLDMSRDVEDRLRMFSGDEYLTVHRIALNIDQIRQYNPPPNPTKITDSRAKKYMELYGETSWELDALRPDVLAGLVRDAVEELIDPVPMDDARQRQFEYKEELKELAARYAE